MFFFILRLLFHSLSLPLSPSPSLFSLSLSSEKHLILRTLFFLSSSFFHRFSKCTFKSNVNTTESIKVLCPFSVWPVPTFPLSLPESFSLSLPPSLSPSHSLNLSLPKPRPFSIRLLPKLLPSWMQVMITNHEHTNQSTKTKEVLFSAADHCC